MPHLSLQLLGPLHITLDGQPVTPLAYDKVWALLTYLALNADRAHRRTSLAGLLWPDQLEPDARMNLRQALARLRRAIGDREAEPPFLLIEREQIRFNQASDHECDATEFDARLAACATHAHRQDAACAACARHRTAALALYRGALLAGFHIEDSDLFEEWATVVRERMHQQALAALDALSAHHERRGDNAAALGFTTRQLELDPWREAAHRQAMRLLALNGKRSAALAQYERCREMLAAELGVEPAPETTSLYERIRANEFEAKGGGERLTLPTTRQHNLPVPPTPFVGRQRELALLGAQLTDEGCRLVTLLGPGGSGKTRLALRLAEQLQATFADGAAFVALAPLSSDDLIVPAVTASLGLTLDGGDAPSAQLLRYLQQQSLLLVLDNLEHLLAPLSPSGADAHSNAALALVMEIMQQAPEVTLLVTSRARLHVQGEWVYDVGGLETPTEPEDALAGDQSAPAFFVQAARRVQAGFDPSPADLAAILRICRLVVGMPLALELAAAWVRVLSCSEIVAEIEASLDILATTFRDLPDRHRSMAAVFDHSWRLLNAEEQRVFAGCSVFRGGFTREAAAHVAGASLPILAALVDQSLLSHDGQGRSVLARQYAATQLEAVQEEGPVRTRHLIFLVELSEEAEPRLRSGPQIVQWHERIEREHDNLRAALDWAFTGGDFELGLRLVGALWEFWMNRGHAREGHAHAERFLARPEALAPTCARAKALHAAGVLAFYRGHNQTARTWLIECIALSRELSSSGRYLLASALIALAYTSRGLSDMDTTQAAAQECLAIGEELHDGYVIGHGLMTLAAVHEVHGSDAQAQECYRKSLDAFEADGQSVQRGTAAMRLGEMYIRHGDYAAAHTCFHRSLSIFEEVGDPIRRGTAYRYLGKLAMAQGHDMEAEKWLTRALASYSKTIDVHSQNLARVLDLLGRLAQQRGDYGRAATLHRESLDQWGETGRTQSGARSIEALACLAARQGEAVRAAMLFGASESYLSASPVPWDLMLLLRDPHLRSEHERLVELARTDLGEAAFAEAWAAGAAMDLEQALAYAVGVS